MDNPEKLATHGTQDEEKQIAQRNMYWTWLYASKHKNVNKTRVLLQTTGGQDEPSIVFCVNRNEHHNMELNEKKINLENQIFPCQNMLLTRKQPIKKFRKIYDHHFDYQHLANHFFPFRSIFPLIFSLTKYWFNISFTILYPRDETRMNTLS